MINLTATTESNPQVLATWTSYAGDAYAQVRCVAWISQDRTNLKTTIKYKWQIYQYNYSPYWDDAHTYTLSLAGVSDSVSFSLPQSNVNGVRDMCSARTLGTFSHDSSGDFSGTFSFSGAKFWETFSYSEEMTLPRITPPEPDPPTPEPVEPDPPTPIVFDNDPRYFIYADGQLVYGAGVEGYEVLNPSLSVEVNKSGSLTFDIPIGSEMYNRLNLLKTTIEARQGNEVLFRGRVLNARRTTMNTISYYCEGFLSWMTDVVLTPYQRQNFQARDLLKLFLNWYNTRASANRKIVYKYSDISAKISIESKEHSNVWEQINDVLVKGVGGYIVPYLTAEETGIQWLSTYGASTAQVIQFGENLLDFNEYIDASNVFTAVRPYGKETDGVRVSLPEEFVVDNNAVNVYGRIERTAIFDEATSESTLRKVATDYLRTGVSSAISMKVSAVDLHLLNSEIERIRIGDSVRVVSVPHSVDAYFLCTKIKYDFAHPQNNVYTFGSTQRTISEFTKTSYNKYVITEES